MNIFNTIKLCIKDSRSFMRVILNHLAPFIKSDELFIKLCWKLRMDYPLNLDNPQTFSEKIQWLKLHDRKPIYTIMVDKYEAKKYVANIIGEEYIIPTLAVYDSVEDINFDTLPDQFVMKCTHDSGGLVICRDKSKLNYRNALNKLSKALKRRYFYQNREWPYKSVRPRIIAEQYMEDHKTHELRDYKFFCFNGEPKYCQVISGRTDVMSIDFFDRDWNHQPFHEPRVFPFADHMPECPAQYDKMWNMAKQLASDKPFSRIDFYNIDGRVYFGEITFYPTSGFGGFKPKEWDLKFGEWIKLPTNIQ